MVSSRMAPDRYSEYLVQNLYYDTEGWDVIRASIERPAYKEKMRLRCYGALNGDGELFLELKKKYRGIVYKRRIAVPTRAFLSRAVRDVVSGGDSQISREIDFYMKANAVSEKIYISYRRTAFVGTADEGLRVTFDTDARFRLDRLDYSRPDDGTMIFPPGKTLTEIKTFGSMPLWLANTLCKNEVFPTSFSKYGVCYTDYILRRSGMERRTPISA